MRWFNSYLKLVWRNKVLALIGLTASCLIFLMFRDFSQKVPEPEQDVDGDDLNGQFKRIRSIGHDSSDVKLPSNIDSLDSNKKFKITHSNLNSFNEVQPLQPNHVTMKKKPEYRPASVVSSSRKFPIKTDQMSNSTKLVNNFEKRNKLYRSLSTTEAPVDLLANRKSSVNRNKRYSFSLSHNDEKPTWKQGLYFDKNAPPDKFAKWSEEKEKFCDGKMFAFANDFAYFADMIIDRDYCTCSLKGGELIENVVNQSEEAEYYNYEMGCFQMKCSKRPDYFFNGENHLNKWLYSLSTRTASQNVSLYKKEFTIAVTRYEYANLYHTMTDWYNAFLMMQFFRHTPATTNILIIDSHPHGALDSVWSHLFNSTVRLSGLPKRTKFRRLVWGIIGYNSPMTTYVSANPPLYEEFRSFFLDAYNIKSRETINCEKLTILFVWRHDYVAHPRNPKGFVSRKIANEVQLLKYVRKKFPNFVVKGIQIDLFDMHQQLEHIANTDILIGMHGAGLTHAVFLPNKSAIIELVPNYWPGIAEHFMSIATWRGLIYEQWYNNDPHMEMPKDSTIVPPRIMITLIKNTMKQLCSNKTSDSRHPRQTPTPTTSIPL